MKLFASLLLVFFLSFQALQAQAEKPAPATTPAATETPAGARLDPLKFSVPSGTGKPGSGYVAPAK